MCCIQLRQVMGKVKTTRKYPCQIKMNIFLMEGQQALYNMEINFQAQQQFITYADLCQSYEIFLREHNIRYQTDMYTIDPNSRYKEIRITEQFEISVVQIEETLGTLFIFGKNRFYEYKVELQNQIRQLKAQLDYIKEAIEDLRPLKDNMQFYRKNSMGAVPNLLAHTQSFFQKDMVTSQIDLGVLFSEPLYNDESKPTASAVDFRSQISRLKIALEDSYTPNITMRCQIGRPESLRNIIRLSKPKILHIICHGSREGFLQFEDNSVNNLGLLNYLKPADVKKLLKDSIDFLPELVFVNSCHSENIGRAFFEMGVKVVIMINSEDLISDQASQMFSEHFYRNLFKGQTISKAFQSAKQTVEIYHYSFGCCCNHNAEEGHKSNCRWINVVTRRHPNPHKDYHVPSIKCKCPSALRNFNRHKDTCEWAKKVLFEINNDFRIKEQESNEYRFAKRSEYPDYCDIEKKQLTICCCPVKNRKPHNQSYKFKCQIQEGYEKKKLYDIVGQTKANLTDLTPAQLLEAHQKSKNIYGRQIQLYQFLKSFKENSMMLVYGKSGAGLTAFTVKAAAYAMQRKVCQFFFFIDLYEIKDEIVFRFKFNQITGFKYNGSINQNGVKNRRILILLDNCDDFLRISPEQFYKEIHNLHKELPKSKFIFNIKEQSLQSFNFKRILCCKFQLPPLQYRFAVGYLTNKLKDKTDITVGCQEFKKLVTTYEVLKIPKVIESLSQSFADVTTKVTYQKIADNVEQISLNDDNALMKEVFQGLRQKSQQAFEFLIFVSQFSQGLSFKDLDMFSSYDKRYTGFKLPIKSDWKKHYEILLQGQTADSSEFSSLLVNTTPKFQTFASYNDSVLCVPDFTEDDIFEETQPQVRRKKSLLSQKQTTDGQMKVESYFIEKAGMDKFMVKRFIRDFVWNKYRNQTTNKMKFLYVIYLSVVLEMLFKSLREQNYVHEELLTYSAISEAGIFSYSTSIQSTIPRRSMTESTRIAHHIMSGLQQIFMKNQSLLHKLKKNDPTSFIINHKQDFLKIYDFNWTNFILQSRKEGEAKQKKLQQIRAEQKIFLCFLQNLMINIPTALKIASHKSQEDQNLLKYVISRSNNQLDNLKTISNPQRSLKLHLKIYLLEIGFILETLSERKFQENKLQLDKIRQKANNLILRFHEKLKGTSQFDQIKKIFHEENNNCAIYLNMENLNEKDEQIFDRIKRDAENWRKNQEIQRILMAKQALLIALNYFNFLKHLKPHIKILKSVKDTFLDEVIEMCQFASYLFSESKCHKLKLKSDLTAIQIYWQYHDRFQHKNQLASPDIYKEIDDWRKKLNQCEIYYLDENNKLGGFTEFDDIIKNLKTQIKEKLWKSAQNSIIFMKAYPLYTYEYPIITNLIRKKNNFRKQIQKILCEKVNNIPIESGLKHKDSNKSIKDKQLINLDISTKFEILTKKKIQQQAQTGCSIMVLACNFRVMNEKLFMIAQGQFLNEDPIEINYEFSKKFHSQKIFILILNGENAVLAMKKIISFCKSPPAIIALNSQPEQNMEQIHTNVQINGDWIRSSLLEQNKIREASLNYIKYFVKKITRERIKQKTEIKSIHEAAYKKLIAIQSKKIKAYIDIRNCPDFYIAYKKGCYRDLSPGYESNHNITQTFYDKHVILRRWKKMIQILRYLKGERNGSKARIRNVDSESDDQQLIQSQGGFSNLFTGYQQTFSQKTSYINIYGQNSSGKSYFVREIAKNLVEREMYDFGVFIFEGKKIQSKYSGDFQKYIKRQGKINQMPVLEDFQRIMGQNMILIIDDFHLIKPRTNARMKLFIDKILEKKVNLILVSNTELNVDWLKNMKRIKLEKMDEFQTEILAYNILDLNSHHEVTMYQNARKQLGRPLSPKQIAQMIKKERKVQKYSIGATQSQSYQIEMKKTYSISH